MDGLSLGWLFRRYSSAAFTGISILGEAFVATSPCAIAPGLPLECFRNCRTGDDILLDVVFASSLPRAARSGFQSLDLGTSFRPSSDVTSSRDRITAAVVSEG